MSAFRRCRVSSAMGPTREKEFLRKLPPVKITSKDDPDNSAAIFTAFVITVRLLKGRRARAMAVVVVPGIQNYYLTFFYHAGGCSCDLQFFPAVQLLFYTQGGIFKNASLRGQRATVTAVDLPLRLQKIEVFADSDLRSAELFG